MSVQNRKEEEDESEYDTENLRWRRLAEVTLYIHRPSGFYEDDVKPSNDWSKTRRKSRKDDNKIVCHCTRLFCKYDLPVFSHYRLMVRRFCWCRMTV